MKDTVNYQQTYCNKASSRKGKRDMMKREEGGTLSNYNQNVSNITSISNQFRQSQKVLAESTFYVDLVKMALVTTRYG